MGWSGRGRNGKERVVLVREEVVVVMCCVVDGLFGGLVFVVKLSVVRGSRGIG